MWCCPFDKHGFVSTSSFVTSIRQIISHSFIPCSQGLFQTIYCPFQFVHIVRMLWIYKPLGCSTYASSCSTPFRNVLFTSICYSVNYLAQEIDISNCTDSSHVTGTNVSSKSRPSTWVYSCATNPVSFRAMLLLIELILIQINTLSFDY